MKYDSINITQAYSLSYICDFICDGDTRRIVINTNPTKKIKFHENDTNGKVYEGHQYPGYVNNNVIIDEFTEE